MIVEFEFKVTAHYGQNAPSCDPLIQMKHEDVISCLFRGIASPTKN